MKTIILTPEQHTALEEYLNKRIHKTCGSYVICTSWIRISLKRGILLQIEVIEKVKELTGCEVVLLADDLILFVLNSFPAVDYIKSL